MNWQERLKDAQGESQRRKEEATKRSNIPPPPPHIPLLEIVQARALLEKVRREVWEGRGDIQPSTIYGSRHPVATDETRYGFSEEGIRLIYLLGSTTQTVHHSGGSQEFGHYDKEYILTRSRNFYTLIAVHVFNFRNERGVVGWLPRLVVWDGELSSGLGRLDDESLPSPLNPNPGSEVKYNTRYKKVVPTSGLDSDTFEELLFQACLPRVLNNERPRQLQSGKR